MRTSPEKVFTAACLAVKGADFKFSGFLLKIGANRGAEFGGAGKMP